MSRWAQFVALGLGQLASRQSLRDIVSNLRAQPAKLYHLGVRTVSRSSLARVNAEQPYTLYEALFGRLLSRCQQRAPAHGFRFRHKLYAVDASTIDLCLAVFPWASFRRTKAAVKLHVGLDQAGHLPSFVSVTDGKTGDVTVARTWTSVVVADRGYLDFTWFHQLQARGVTFVTRLKRGVRYRVTHEHDVRAGTGILSDQTIELTSARSRKVYPDRLRRVVYRDPLTRNRYVFVTNNTTCVGAPPFSWTRIKGESMSPGGGGMVRSSWVGGDEGSPEGDRSRRRRGGDGVGGLGAGTTVEREPETGVAACVASRSTRFREVGVEVFAWRGGRPGRWPVSSWV